jgi:hypothetical protein
MKSFLQAPYRYLFVAEAESDAAILDSKIAEKEITAYKLGENVYLGFFREAPEALYPVWKSRWGLEKPLHWFALPPAQVTG